MAFRRKTDRAWRDVPLGPPPPPQESDVRLKTDIRRIGRTDDGHALYAYRYRSGGGLEIGVMAQEVLQTRPDAVSAGADGFLRVDYDALGLTDVARANIAARAVLPAPMGPPPVPVSDRRLKRDIQRIGETLCGLPLYTYRYRSGGGLQVGVMAQDVRRHSPEALRRRDDGFLAVDYATLGLGDLGARNMSLMTDDLRRDLPA